MTTNLYVRRGGRDFYDVIVEELQEGCEILAAFFDGSSEYVDVLVGKGEEDEERIAMPFFLANYYETHAKLERLRQRIAARKEEQAEAEMEKARLSAMHAAHHTNGSTRS